ncbi:Acetylglutamate kinase [Methanimicrococcus hongohii]|uniref:Acetylglutamate kinase n=1 Tax=Methanimicrococcus hongohii TaxID=3028295 RepID=A0AA96V093_9EURY|nr:acetylglutamate kinase [Methanimicrococcus sp. Hf6]WNY23994.1 Acetylglutamate kinase [Methanimicrococcus sp. Hf6]
MALKFEDVLIESLPYIRDFSESTMVIKVGGNAMLNAEKDTAIMEKIIQDIVLLHYVGINPIVIHGGGPEINEKMEKMGKQPKFIGGLRVTDDDTLEIAMMVLVGNINTKMVSLINKHGGKGVGLNGIDANLIVAAKKKNQKVIVDGNEEDVDIGWVGETEIINPRLLKMMMENNYIPVISPVAVDKNGHMLNINADTVAGDIAAALGAKKLIMMTDISGVLRDVNDKESRISKIKLSEIDDLVKEEVITGGMIPKIKGAEVAVRSGVESVHIINGSTPHSLLLELFTDTGVGTMIFDEEE